MVGARSLCQRCDLIGLSGVDYFLQSNLKRDGFDYTDNPPIGSCVA